MASKYKAVVQNFIRTADKICQLTYEDGTVIETTWSHPFYIEWGNRRAAVESENCEAVLQVFGWVKAEELRAGDVSKTDKGTLRIAKMQVDPRSEEVYIFEVAENHTYLVTDQGVVVHNAANYQWVERGNCCGQGCLTGVLKTEWLGEEILMDLEAAQYVAGYEKGPEGFTRVYKGKNGERVLYNSEKNEYTVEFTDKYGNKIKETFPGRDFPAKPNLLGRSPPMNMEINGHTLLPGDVIVMNSHGKPSFQQKLNELKVPDSTGGVLFGQNYDTRASMAGLDKTWLLLQKYGIDNVVSVHNPTRGVPYVTDTLESATLKATNESSIGRGLEMASIRALINTGKIKTIIARSQAGIMGGIALKEYGINNDISAMNSICVGPAQSPDEMPHPQRLNHFRRYVNPGDHIPLAGEPKFPHRKINQWYRRYHSDFYDKGTQKGSGQDHDYDQYMGSIEKSLKEILKDGGGL
ncbi:MAG: polymorphic toxin-type HINT domain-containing protein [Leptospiraceae bacterium]